MTNKTITTEDNKTYSVGKMINTEDFKIYCKGCKAKFKNFVRYCLSTDNIKWNCQNCLNEFSAHCRDLELKEENTLKIIFFNKHCDICTSKEYALINNKSFNEIKEVTA